MLVDFFGYLVFGQGAKHLLDDLAVFKQKKRGNASDALLRSGCRILVNIQLCNNCLSFVIT